MLEKLKLEARVLKKCFSKVIIRSLVYFYSYLSSLDKNDLFKKWILTPIEIILFPSPKAKWYFTRNLPPSYKSDFYEFIITTSIGVSVLFNMFGFIVLNMVFTGQGLNNDVAYPAALSCSFNLLHLGYWITSTFHTNTKEEVIKEIEKEKEVLEETDLLRPAMLTPDSILLRSVNNECSR